MHFWIHFRTLSDTLSDTLHTLLYIYQSFKHVYTCGNEIEDDITEFEIKCFITTSDVLKEARYMYEKDCSMSLGSPDRKCKELWNIEEWRRL